MWKIIGIKNKKVQNVSMKNAIIYKLKIGVDIYIVIKLLYMTYTVDNVDLTDNRNS